MWKITPFLWFNGQAEEAAHFYTSIFNNSELFGAMERPGPDRKARRCPWNSSSREKTSSR